MKNIDDMLTEFSNLVKNDSIQTLQEKIQSYPSDQILPLICHNSSFLYEKMKTELDQTNFSKVLDLIENKVIDHIKNTPYETLPITFLQNLAGKPILIHLLEKFSSKPLIKVLKRFRDKDLPQLQVYLTDQHPSGQLLDIMLKMNGDHVLELIHCVIYDKSPEFLQECLLSYYSFLSCDAILLILNKMNLSTRHATLKSTLSNQSFFYEYLLTQKGLSVLQLIKLFDDQLDSTLVDCMMKHILAQMKSGENQDAEIQALPLFLSEPLKSKLILDYYQQLSLEMVISLLDKMTVVGRYNCLLSPVNHRLLIENLTLSAEMTPLAFKSLFSIMRDNHTKYKLLTHPVQYGVKKQFIDNSAANTAATAISSAASYLPFFGQKVAKSVESYQSEIPVYEFLLSKLLSLQPHLLETIPDILHDLQSEQATEILSNPSSDGQSIFLKLVCRQTPDALIQFTSRLHYETKDEGKLLDPKKISIDALKEKIKSPGLIGFIALLTIYNYLGVRSREKYPEQYQINKEDFLSLLSLLLKSQDASHSCLMVENYCKEHPLSDGVQIPTAVIPIKIGTTRYKDARDQLLSLTIPELNEGFKSFLQFIQKRVEQDQNRDVNSLDRRIQSLVDRHQALALTF